MALVGPTATGKSALALRIARHTGAEILSVDSMQVYRGMDIGTAKPTEEEQADVVHHMVDVVEVERRYTVADFRADARRALSDTTTETVLIVGGSGLHFRSVVDPMTFAPRDALVAAEVEAIDHQLLVEELLAADAEADRHVDLANPRRVRRAVESWRVASVTPSDIASSRERRRYRSYVPELDFVGLGIDRSAPEPAIRHRLAEMRRRGFLDEVGRLAPRLNRSARQAVGYRQLLEVVEGRAGLEEGYEAAARATMDLVKRQRTFLRRDPRLTWFDADHPHLENAVMERVTL